MKVYLETLGCQMNRLDSELVRSRLRASGHEMVAEASEADVVLYNTCSVRDHAEQKVLSRLGADGQRKAAGKRLIVGVLGCMAQRMGTQLRQAAPCVDIICGPGQLARLPQMLEVAADGEVAVATTPRPPPPTTRMTGSTWSATLKIRRQPRRLSSASRVGATGSAPTASCRSFAGRKSRARPTT